MQENSPGNTTANIRELFADYRFKKCEISRLRADKCLVTDSVRGSSPDAPYTARHIKVTGVDAEKMRCNKIRIESMEAECAYVEAAIALAPNSKTRLVLEARYIDGLDWPEVQHRVGLEGKSVDTVKKIAYAYLDLLKKEKEQRAV